MIVPASYPGISTEAQYLEGTNRQHKKKMGKKKYYFVDFMFVLVNNNDMNIPIRSTHCFIEY